MKTTIKELTPILKGNIVLGDPKTVVKRASVDSRQIKMGDIFFALKGDNTDGHEFAMTAIRSDASAVVVKHLNWLESSHGVSAGVIQVADPYDALQQLGQFLRNIFRGKVVGITGSNGKTTTKQMVAGILAQTAPGLATPGNYNSQIGLPLVLSRIKSTDKWMVLEMGATEPGHIHHLSEIARPHIGIITSIGPAHLASFGSLVRIAESKWELIESLPSDGCAVLPWGEPALEPHIRSFKNKIIFFGEDSCCPIRASAIHVGEKIEFTLHVGSQRAFVHLPFGGRFNVKNAMAAAAAAYFMDIPIETIVKGLENFKPPDMRMEIQYHPSGAVLVNDAYNANPASMENSVRSFVESFDDKKRVVVLGSMLELGSESEKLHFHVGGELGRLPIDRMILVGSEVKPLKEGSLAAGLSSDHIIEAGNYQEVLAALSPFLNTESAILFKGSRGVHLEEVIGALNETETETETETEVNK
jgi:UDP-N-acetylmuramoyl-tripeptide--D-alanyl-D-alanine ligase